MRERNWDEFFKALQGECQPLMEQEFLYRIGDKDIRETLPKHAPKMYLGPEFLHFKLYQYTFEVNIARGGEDLPAEVCLNYYGGSRDKKMTHFQRYEAKGLELFMRPAKTPFPEVPKWVMDFREKIDACIKRAYRPASVNFILEMEREDG